MPDWTAFAGFAGVVLALLLLLAYASRDTLRHADGPPRHPDGEGVTDAAGGDRPADPTDGDRLADVAGGTGAVPRPGAGRPGVPELTTAELLANVVLSQGVLGVLLLAGAWVTGVPAAAVGLPGSTAVPLAVALGAALGVGLYAANEAGAAAGERFGLGHSEALRAALAPDSPTGWAVLLLVALPVVAGFEELLFRGVLVGAMAAGFEVSPWLLAVGSSAAFAVGHGAQGPGGMAVTGLLGLVLAAAFLLTGSLVVVVVAHYLVNALEFVVHEGLGVEWPAGRDRGSAD